MKTLVTGGAGFIGSHLLDRLASLKHQVIVIDNLSSGLRESIHPSLQKMNVQFVLGDCTSAR